jgi:hypothetical protein
MMSREEWWEMRGTPDIPHKPSWWRRLLKYLGWS